MTADPSERPRAADRRPLVVLFDVFETMLRVDALAARLVDVGRPAHEWELFFTRALRDGTALTLAGAAPPLWARSPPGWRAACPRWGNRRT